MMSLFEESDETKEFLAAGFRKKSPLGFIFGNLNNSKIFADYCRLITFRERVSKYEKNKIIYLLCSSLLHLHCKAKRFLTVI